MVKRMLIDATHPEETRAVVLDDRYLVDFDFETSTKLQLKGNIYLAKITRVEERNRVPAQPNHQVLINNSTTI